MLTAREMARMHDEATCTYEMACRQLKMCAKTNGCPEKGETCNSMCIAFRDKRVAKEYLAQVKNQMQERNEQVVRNNEKRAVVKKRVKKARCIPLWMYYNITS